MNKQGLNNGGRNSGGGGGARWDLSPMPTPRPMPILPRPAVASSDFRPYSSSLNVVLEPTNPKASRPPLKAASNSILEADLPAPRGGSGAHGGAAASMASMTSSARGGSLKQAASSLLSAAKA